MKKLLFGAAIMGLLITTSCKKDDDGGESRLCKTCEIAGASSVQYCDNGDGTVTMTVGGQSQTTSLEGLSFNEFIATFQQVGFTCR